MIPMFGEYQYQVDKGRVSIPGKWRQNFRPGLNLAIDKERKFITVQPCEEPELVLDKRGRLTIPRALWDEVDITDTAIVVGACTYLEVWNPLKWEKEWAR